MATDNKKVEIVEPKEDAFIEEEKDEEVSAVEEETHVEEAEHNKRVEMMRYRKNKIGFWMCIIAIVLQCFSFMFVYHCLQLSPKSNTGIDILVNIVFLLFVFLASEKLKSYSVEWGYITIAIGLVNAVRIFTYLFSPYSGEDLVHVIPAHFFWISFVCYILVAVVLTIGGVITILRGKELRAYLSTLSDEEKGAH